VQIDYFAAASAIDSPAADVRTLLSFLAAAEAALLGAREPRAAAAAPGNATVVGSPFVTLASALPLEYAGASLAVGDFNGDGSDDVAMGAWGHSLNADPTAAAGSRLLMQAGAVYTQVCVRGQRPRRDSRSYSEPKSPLPSQYGNASVAASNASTNASAPPAPPIPFPDAPTYGAELFARLGWSL